MTKRTITLTIEANDDEVARLIQRFVETANAVTGEVDGDDGIPSDPNGSKVDSVGVVWDARFHGVKMTKNQDGTWRRKKNLTDQEKQDADNYELGCRGTPTAAATAAVAATPAGPGVAVTTPAPVAAPVPAPAADVPAFLQTGAFTPAAPVMPAPGLPGLPAAIPAAPPAPAPVSYPELIAAFQETIGRVGQVVVDANLARIYAEANVTAMPQLEAEPETRIKIKAALEALQPVAA